MILLGCPAQKADKTAPGAGESVPKDANQPRSTQTSETVPQPSPRASQAAQLPAGQPPATPQATPTAIPPSSKTAQEILDEMVAAYRSAQSYGDQGRIVMRGTYDGQPFETRVNYVTAWERPNKLRLIAGDGVIICDGKDLWGFVSYLPGQVLKVPAPEKFDLKTLFSDTVLANALMQGPGQLYSLIPPPLVLLLAEDPLKTLLYRSDPPELISPGTTGTFTCDRIRIGRTDGDVVLWIDRQSKALVRIDLPPERVRQSLDGARLQNLAIYADFVNPVLNGQIDAEAFTFVVPTDAKLTAELHPHGYDYLGTTPGDFEFRDLNGQPVTSASLAGKPVVLEFWSRNHPGSEAVLKAIQAVADQFSQQVAFYAVSVDHVVDALDSPAITNDELQSLLQKWGVSIPLLRDPRNDAERVFGATFRRNLVTVPCLVILNAQGVIQTYHLGMVADLVDRLGGTLEKILSGVDLVEEERAGFAKMKSELAKLVEEAAQHGLFTFPLDEITATGSVQAAPASQPTRLKLTPIFRCNLLKSPGNLVVVPANDGDERLFCVEENNTATEIGWDGQVKARHPLKPVPPDKIDFLRTAVGGSGQRLFVAWSLGSQQISVFDDNFNLLLRYPGENSPPHDGAADAHFVDLTGDGQLELVAGFLGVIGVQAISLDGQRLWANRTATVAFRMGILSPDAQGHPSLLVTNTTRGSAVQIGHDGQRLREVIVPGRTIAWLAAADLDGDGTTELCGLDPRDFAQTEAFGFNLAGDELWHYTLPKGMVQHPVEQITWGRILPGQTQQWVLLGADGSIHIVDHTGQPVDHFNVGAFLTGVAVSQVGGQTVLAVATPDEVLAWKVESNAP